MEYAVVAELAFKYATLSLSAKNEPPKKAC